VWGLWGRGLLGAFWCTAFCKDRYFAILTDGAESWQRWQVPGKSRFKREGTYYMNMRRIMFGVAVSAAMVTLGVPGSALAATGNGGAASHAASALTAHVAASGRQAATYKYCYTVIAKIDPPKPASRVVSRGCSSQHAAGSVLPQGVTIPATEAPLVTFYQNEGFTGSSDTIYGDNGPCDASGYGLSDLTYENDWVIGGISAYQTHSSCWGQKYWNHTSGWSPYTTPCKTFTNSWEVSYVGAACNDDLYSMWLWNNK
jgi:hypothetical protein